jgi:hypothetical protein
MPAVPGSLPKCALIASSSRVPRLSEGNYRSRVDGNRTSCTGSFGRSQHSWRGAVPMVKSSKYGDGRDRARDDRRGVQGTLRRDRQGLVSHDPEQRLRKNPAATKSGRESVLLLGLRTPPMRTTAWRRNRHNLTCALSVRRQWCALNAVLELGVYDFGPEYGPVFARKRARGAVEAGSFRYDRITVGSRKIISSVEEDRAMNVLQLACGSRRLWVRQHSWDAAVLAALPHPARQLLSRW